jgi:hypothetical protein
MRPPTSPHREPMVCRRSLRDLAPPYEEGP